MREWINTLSFDNWISIGLLLLIGFSVLAGLQRGARGSARQLASILMGGVVTVVSLFLAWQASKQLSPWFQQWLTERNITVPNEKLDAFSQLFYTAVTAIRDFSLMRSAVLFLLSYSVIRGVLGWLGNLLLFANRSYAAAEHRTSALNSAAGGLIGLLTGAARALLVIAVLFVYTSLDPQSSLSRYIGQSALYQKAAKEIIQPVTGDWLSNQLPVLTRKAEAEYNGILQRKYDVIDASIPNNISEAAREVTAKEQTDEDKARALYKWVGTRIQYDWSKVDLYENKGIWKEQTPEETFASRQGVCIDFSRLYSVMAKSVGLDVRVVTGLGYDGRGGYGSHAWNEVYVGETKGWIPLDSTWVASGGDWFNPPNFNETHIRKA